MKTSIITMNAENIPTIQFTEVEYKGNMCFRDEYGNIYNQQFEYIEKEENERKRQKKIPKHPKEPVEPIGFNIPNNI